MSTQMTILSLLERFMGMPFLFLFNLQKPDQNSVHAITKSLTPRVPSPSGGTTLPNPGTPATGIESLETQYFRLSCFQTLTGTKFLLFTDPLAPNVDSLMKGVYERYADFVTKNPFYQLEMPVRVEAFDRSLNLWLKSR
jgi:trafficking protein particle complex subunit 4